MAIIIEEQKQGGTRAIGGMLVWLFAMVLLGVSVYYLFFTHPELIEIPPPEGFQNESTLSRIDLQMADPLKAQISEQLKSQVIVSEGGTFGRPNPFIGF